MAKYLYYALILFGNYEEIKYMMISFSHFYQFHILVYYKKRELKSSISSSLCARRLGILCSRHIPCGCYPCILLFLRINRMSWVKITITTPIQTDQPTYTLIICWSTHKSVSFVLKFFKIIPGAFFLYFPYFFLKLHVLILFSQSSSLLTPSTL